MKTNTDIITPADFIKFAEVKKATATQLIKKIREQLTQVVDTFELLSMERSAERQFVLIMDNMDFSLDSIERMKDHSQEDQEKTVSFHINYSNGTKEALSALTKLEEHATAIEDYHQQHRQLDQPVLTKINSLVADYRRLTESVEDEIKRHLREGNYTEAAYNAINFEPVNPTEYFGAVVELPADSRACREIKECGAATADWCARIVEKEISPKHVVGAQVLWYTNKIKAAQEELLLVNDSIRQSILESGPSLESAKGSQVGRQAARRLRTLQNGMNQVHEWIEVLREKTIEHKALVAEDAKNRPIERN